jgi:quercetin dioxygenase-like cupin family protein/sugar lactone lactonase YvrE
MSRTKIQQWASAIALLVAVHGGTARADQGARNARSTASVTRKLLDQRPVEGTPGLQTQLWLIEYPPGASAPPHHHPVPGIGYVIEGAFDSAFADGPVQHVGAGQSFVDPAQVQHRLFRNSSADHPLRFLVAYTLPSGAPTFEMDGPRVRLEPAAKPIVIERDALYPETVEADSRAGRLLVSSVREGAVYAVGLDGSSKPLVRDDRLISVLGIAIDQRSNRLWVTNSDLGVGLRRSAQGPKKLAGVGSYDLSSGRALQYADLASLVPADHLINGITVDADGNAYATDSFAPAIYRVDPSGHPSVFLTDDEFRGPGINLNGIVYHPKGFLLAVKKSDGALYRIPLADPRHFSRVHVPATFVGGDGILLAGPEHMLVISNRTPGFASNTAFVLQSKDDWLSAEVTESKPLGDGYPTTCTALDGQLYLLSSHLDEWISSTGATRSTLLSHARRGELRALGTLVP